ncbi:HVA22-like protein f [Mangifera indica]|uniref:HVA22-like protein f n=1 Tax=Mangifera indica TaxID=29780 RepID=UPI001CFBEF03|nr:HVA22-like protein f [Mangifera indica]
MGVLAVIAKRLDALVGPGVMFLYPLYESMRAIESPSTLDDRQWLTYWIMCSFITLFELSCYKILAWLPFWPYVKLLFCLWLVLPKFHGAAYIYANYIRKYVKIGGLVGSSKYTEGQKKVLEMMSFDARKLVIQYVDKYGWETLERAIKAAEREAKKR